MDSNWLEKLRKDCEKERNYKKYCEEMGCRSWEEMSGAERAKLSEMVDDCVASANQFFNTIGEWEEKGILYGGDCIELSVSEGLDEIAENYQMPLQRNETDKFVEWFVDFEGLAFVQKKWKVQYIG